MGDSLGRWSHNDGARGENRINEAQLDLFADRLSTAIFRAGQLRVWLSSAACVLTHALRRFGGSSVPAWPVPTWSGSGSSRSSRSAYGA